MKHLITFISLIAFAFTLNAQYIYNDFDGNQNETFSGWPNVPTIITNPDQTGINTSAGVAEFIDFKSTVRYGKHQKGFCQILIRPE